jgi:hypothetical protein
LNTNKMMWFAFGISVVMAVWAGGFENNKSSGKESLPPHPDGKRYPVIPLS